MRLDPTAVAQVTRHLADARPGMCIWPHITHDVLHQRTDCMYEVPAPPPRHDHRIVRIRLAPVVRPPVVRIRLPAAAWKRIRPTVHVDHRPAPWRPRWRPRWRWTVAGPGHDPDEGWAWTRRGAHRAGGRAADLAYRRTWTGR